MQYEFSNLHVLVVGDVMLDRYWFGQASRISPEAPVPVVHHHHTDDRAGGAANVAANITALGAQCDLLGFVSDDEAGQALTNVLKKHQVAAHLIAPKLTDTHTKLRVYSNKQQVARFDFSCHFNDEDKSSLI